MTNPLDSSNSNPIDSSIVQDNNNAVGPNHSPINASPSAGAITQDNAANASPTLHPAGDINTLTYGSTPGSAEAGLDNASVSADPDTMRQYSSTMQNEVVPAGEQARGTLVGINPLPGQFPQADALTKQISQTVDDTNQALTAWEQNVKSTAQAVSDTANGLQNANSQATTVAGSSAGSSGTSDAGSSGAAIISSSATPAEPVVAVQPAGSSGAAIISSSATPAEPVVAVQPAGSSGTAIISSSSTSPHDLEVVGPAVGVPQTPATPATPAVMTQPTVVEAGVPQTPATPAIPLASPAP
jgi:hypothetical protein